MKNYILLIILLFLISCDDKPHLEGRYGNDDELIYIEFSDNNNFKLFTPSGPKCGNLDYAKGVFNVESDTLILKLDYNYPAYIEDYNKQNFEFHSYGLSKNDSLTLHIEVFDLTSNSPLPETEININGQTYLTNYDGKFISKIPVNNEHRISAKIDNTPQIDTSFIGLKNTKIRIVLKSELMDLSKDYIIKYEVIKASKERLIIKTLDKSEKLLNLIKSN
jgi:sporulation protein YlmC with PRC-barrel domain